MPRQFVGLAVQIVRFVDPSQPGWVECEFTDVEGRTHKLTDKVPILTTEDMDFDSDYPKPGVMPCELLARWTDSTGRELARISTEYPLGDESSEGLTGFVVFSAQLSEYDGALGGCEQIR